MTAVDKKRFSFTVNDSLEIVTPYFAVHEDRYKLPAVGEDVNVKSSHRHSSFTQNLKIFLCENSSIECTNYCDAEDSFPVKLIKENQLSVTDLRYIDFNSNVVENHLRCFATCSVEHVTSSIVNVLTGKYEPVRGTSCLRRRLPRFALKTISTCKYVEETNDCYSNFPHWSFGVHASKQNVEFLTGYLYFEKIFCLLFLKDKEKHLPCITSSRNNTAIEHVVNNIVLITKFCIFTEVCKERDVLPFQYVYFDLSDVHVLNVPVSIERLPALATEPIGFKYKFKFTLINKSSVSRNRLRWFCIIFHLLTG